jgi:cyanate lyase
MSMIDCKVTVEKKADPKGDRVVLTFEWVTLIDAIKQLI